MGCWCHKAVSCIDFLETITIGKINVSDKRTIYPLDLSPVYSLDFIPCHFVHCDQLSDPQNDFHVLIGAGLDSPDMSDHDHARAVWCCPSCISFQSLHLNILTAMVVGHDWVSSFQNQECVPHSRQPLVFFRSLVSDRNYFEKQWMEEKLIPNSSRQPKGRIIHRMLLYN